MTAGRMHSACGHSQQDDFVARDAATQTAVQCTRRFAPAMRPRPPVGRVSPTRLRCAASLYWPDEDSRPKAPHSLRRHAKKHGPLRRRSLCANERKRARRWHPIRSEEQMRTLYAVRHDRFTKNKLIRTMMVMPSRFCVLAAQQPRRGSVGAVSFVVSLARLSVLSLCQRKCSLRRDTEMGGSDAECRAN